jgi:ferric-dicitrate binding protein FerR (iron transport regulator)
MKQRLLDQLEDKEAILLMYLAEELSPAERQEVDQMLAADPDFARQLQGLSQLQDSTQQAVKALDNSEPAEASQSALRRASRLLRQYADDRRQPAPVEVVHRAFPWMRYGFSVAAAVLIGCMIWWNVQPTQTVRQEPAHVAIVPVPPPEDSQAVVALLIDTMDNSGPDDGVTRQIAAADSRVDDLDFPTDAAKASLAQ